MINRSGIRRDQLRQDEHHRRDQHVERRLRQHRVPGGQILRLDPQVGDLRRAALQIVAEVVEALRVDLRFLESLDRVRREVEELYFLVLSRLHPAARQRSALLHDGHAGHRRDQREEEGRQR
jgi:hypothetical protein